MSVLSNEQVRHISSLLPQISRNLRLPVLIDSVHHGLTASQLMALFVLEEADDRGLSMTGLAEELRIALATASGIVDHLVRDGLVQRLPHPDDRRMVIISLTDSGRDVVRRMLQTFQEVLAGVIEKMSLEERDATIQAVERIHRLSVQVRDEERLTMLAER